jgi:hypothetical protein
MAILLSKKINLVHYLPGIQRACIQMFYLVNRGEESDDMRDH